MFNATIDDVKEFHGKYYVPNNATLTLAGDFDTDEAKAMIEKYFGEIPGGETVVDMDPMPVSLEKTVKLYHEDNFARTPAAYNGMALQLNNITLMHMRLIFLVRY